MERNGDDQGDDPGRGRIKCCGKLLRHEIHARLGVTSLAFCAEWLKSYRLKTCVRQNSIPRGSPSSAASLEVEGHPPFKDAKIFPGGAREWDWRETGTRHVPGIQPADVQELIEHGARTVVLSKGVWERLQVCPETLEVLSKNDIQVEVLQTEAAVERFNELRENIAVGGLFHSTC